MIDHYRELTYREWFGLNVLKIRRFVKECIERDRPDWVCGQLVHHANPDGVRSAVQSFSELTPESRRNNMFRVFAYDSVISGLIGQRGTGKTASLLDICENVHFVSKCKRSVCVFNVPSDGLPDYIESLKFDRDSPYSNVGKNTLIVHDEVHKDINSKSWESTQNLKVRDYLSTIRHENNSIIFSTQLASNLSLDMIRQFDCLLIKQLPYFSDQDRQNFFRKYQFLDPNRKDRVLFDYGGKYQLTECKLPSFWNERISTGHV